MGLGNGLTSDEPALNGEGDGRLKLKLAAPVVSSKTRKVLVVSDNVGDVLKNLTVVLLAYMHSQELGKKSSGPLSPVLPTTGLIISAYLLWTYEFIWWCDLFFSQTGCYKSECRRWLLNQGRYPDSDLRTAKDGQCMKVTGLGTRVNGGEFLFNWKFDYYQDDEISQFASVECHEDFIEECKLL
uniref:Uncharacterized protein n=1 Tax=Oryza nivara TaxID=4536 RepID=A0A0E0I8N2_ORYNI